MEYPSAHEFFSRSNTHDPDQDGFPDLYRRDFIHTLSRVARRKLGHHRLDPYQRGIVRRNIGEEEADCHRHGHFTRLSLDSFILFAKSNSSHIH